LDSGTDEILPPSRASLPAPLIKGLPPKRKREKKKICSFKKKILKFKLQKFDLNIFVYFFVLKNASNFQFKKKKKKKQNRGRRISHSSPHGERTTIANWKVMNSRAINTWQHRVPTMKHCHTTHQVEAIRYMNWMKEKSEEKKVTKKEDAEFLRVKPYPYVPCRNAKHSS